MVSGAGKSLYCDYDGKDCQARIIVDAIVKEKFWWSMYLYGVKLFSN